MTKSVVVVSIPNFGKHDLDAWDCYRVRVLGCWVDERSLLDLGVQVN